MDCEILISERETKKSFRVLKALEESAPFPVHVTSKHNGQAELLVLWGIGRDGHHQARDSQVAAGGHCAMWDMGYFQNGDEPYYRVSLDHQHPQAWLDRTTADSSRFDALGLQLENISKPNGHVLVIGMGHKSHAFLKTHGWEQEAVRRARRQFPGRQIVLRPKPRKGMAIPPIRTAMQGASLVVCRHSNVGVLGALYGVPVSTEDGAAVWLRGKEYTEANRLDFLRRLAHWQYRITEFQEAWNFITKITAR